MNTMSPWKTGHSLLLILIMTNICNHREICYLILLNLSGSGSYMHVCMYLFLISWCIFTGSDNFEVTVYLYADLVQTTYGHVMYIAC